MSRYKKALIPIVVASLIGLSGCDQGGSKLGEQALVDSMSSQLKLTYQVVDNHAGTNGVDCSGLGADWGVCSRILLTFNNSGKAINNDDWAIYFHSIRIVLASENDQFKVTRVTGDLHKLEPTSKFTGFEANKTTSIPVIMEYWQVAQSDAMPRWYVTAGSAKPKVIANTETEDVGEFALPLAEGQWKRTAGDNNILMTPVTRYQKNSDIQTLPEQSLRGKLIPSPLKSIMFAEDIDISSGVTIGKSTLSSSASNVIRQKLLDQAIPINSSGHLLDISTDPEQFDSTTRKGAYRLTVKPEGTTITGYDDEGTFNGAMSFLSLIPAGKTKAIPAVIIDDAPRFDYRGIFVDIGRNFKSKATIKEVLDQMASYKLNKFHFHLSDDEGWRIEIPGLPELTDVGSQRCHDLTERRCLLPQLGSGPNNDNNGSGYLTRADYIEIVKYARERFIEVIPEIDMPAHARAAVVSMEARYQRLVEEGKEVEANEYRLVDPADTSQTTSVQFYDRRSYLNPCLPSSRHFTNKVISEIVKMHIEAGQPLKTWHFGGDEAKNIRLGAGYQDINAANKVSGKGTIDQGKEDLPWARSPVCQQLIAEGTVSEFAQLPSYFALEVSKLIKAHDINQMQAWQDGLRHTQNTSEFAVDHVRINFWDTLYWGGANAANEWKQKGFDIIVSNPDYVYLDMPNEVNPLERGYYWATRYNDERKIFSFAPDNLPQNAETSVDRDGNAFSSRGEGAWGGSTGISAQVWTETIRTDDQFKYMLYPRLIAVAERAWSKAPWELAYQEGREFKGNETNFVNKASLLTSWTLFSNLVGQRELEKLDQQNINYRLPVPGARVNEGKLEANINFPGLPIEYSLDGGNSWLTYDVPVAVADNINILVRSSSSDGKRKGRAEPVN